MHTAYTCHVLQVDVLMLDLDVGFIGSPMNIVRKLGSSKSDVFVQVTALTSAYKLLPALLKDRAFRHHAYAGFDLFDGTYIGW